MVEYSPELAQRIVDRVAAGESVNAICTKELSLPPEQRTYPTHKAFFDWLAKYPDVASEYTRACYIRADARVDRIDTIAESMLKGKIPPDIARVFIDKEKWQAGKESPKYADKAAQNNVQINVNNGASAEDMAAIKALLDEFTLPDDDTLLSSNTLVIDHEVGINVPVIESSAVAYIDNEKLDVVADKS